MFTRKMIAKAICASVLGTSYLALPSIALAQEDDAQVEKISVTGSRIKRTDIEGPSPITSISAEEMLGKGFVTVQDAINSLTQGTGGQFDQQQTFGFTPSASAVDIRGFGPGRTLVLLNGRRLPQFPLAAGGTSNFVDLSSIPSSAIQRIDVLTDGAGAIYGSDAISGVVNVILKKDLDKTTVNLRYGDTSDGGQEQTRLQISTGLENENTSVLFFMEYLDREVLKFNDRDMSRFDVLNPNDPDSVGAFSSGGIPGTFRGTEGNVISPDCDPNLVIGGFCRFNRAQFRQLLAPIKRGSIATVINHEVNDDLDVFGQFMYTTSNVVTELEPMFFDSGSFGPMVGINAPNNPTSGLNDPNDIFVDQAGHFRRRLVEFGPRSSDVDSNSINLLVGAKGTIADDFDWEFGYNYSKQDIVNLRSGFASQDRFLSLICGTEFLLDGTCDNGTLNLFEPIDQATVDATSASPYTDAQSTISSFDFQISGPMFEMSAGEAQFAVVLEHNKTTFVDERDQDTLNGNVISTGGTSGGGERKYTALGVETVFPLTEQIELTVAGRYDSYDDDSDVGGAFSPKVAATYRPTENLLFRASWAESFRAPDMQRLFGAQTRGFNDLIDTPFCEQQGGTRGDANIPACVEPVQSVPTLTGANLALEEEEGTSYNIGAVWQYDDMLEVEINVFSIKLEGIVTTPARQFILDNPELFAAEAIARDPNRVNALNPGGLSLVAATAQNLAFQKNEGVDFNFTYTHDLGEYGTLTGRFNTTYTATFESQADPTAPVVDELNDTNGRLNEGPEWRSNLNIGWNYNELSVNAFINYIGEFTPDQTASQSTVDSFTTLNLTSSYAMTDNVTVLVGFNNVLNEEPPLDLSDGNSSQPFYNQSFHNLTGREFYIEGQFSF